MSSILRQRPPGGRWRAAHFSAASQASQGSDTLDAMRLSKSVLTHFEIIQQLKIGHRAEIMEAVVDQLSN
jgi:hypothetical protein